MVSRPSACRLLSRSISAVARPRRNPRSSVPGLDRVHVAWRGYRHSRRFPADLYQDQLRRPADPVKELYERSRGFEDLAELFRCRVVADGATTESRQPWHFSSFAKASANLGAQDARTANSSVLGSCALLLGNFGLAAPESDPGLLFRLLADPRHRGSGEHRGKVGHATPGEPRCEQLGDGLPVGIQIARRGEVCAQDSLQEGEGTSQPGGTDEVSELLLVERRNRDLSPSAVAKSRTKPSSRSTGITANSSVGSRRQRTMCSASWAGQPC